MPVTELSTVNLGGEGTTLVTLALQHNNQVEPSFLLKVEVQQPQLLLPLVLDSCLYDMDVLHGGIHYSLPLVLDS